jgi:hypothetical protein
MLKGMDLINGFNNNSIYILIYILSTQTIILFKLTYLYLTIYIYTFLHFKPTDLTINTERTTLLEKTIQEIIKLIILDNYVL